MMMPWPREVMEGELRPGHIWELFRRQDQQNLVTLGWLWSKEWIVKVGAGSSFLPGDGMHCRRISRRRHGLVTLKEIYRAAIWQDRLCWGPPLPLLPFILNSLCQFPQNAKSWTTHPFTMQDGCEDEMRERICQCLGHRKHRTDILSAFLPPANSGSVILQMLLILTREYINTSRDGLRDKG